MASKYTGKTGSIEIDWDGVSSTTLSSNEYIHQNPPYKVAFTLSNKEIKATFSVPYSLYTKYGISTSSRWFFGYKVGIKIIYTQNSNKYTCIIDRGIWSWDGVNNLNDHQHIISAQWQDLEFKNSNNQSVGKKLTQSINTYINNTDANNYIEFLPVCIGCDDPSHINFHTFIDNNNNLSSVLTSDKYTYKIKNPHIHIATPSIQVVKTTGKTIKIQDNSGGAFTGGIALKDKTIASYSSSDSNNTLTFSSLSIGTEYDVKIKRTCSCGTIFASSKMTIKTWNTKSVNDNNLSIPNKGAYKRIQFGATSTRGTSGISAGLGSNNTDIVKYDLYSLNGNGSLNTILNTNTIDTNLTYTNNSITTNTQFSSSLNQNTKYACKVYNNEINDNSIIITKSTGNPFTISEESVINISNNEATFRAIINLNDTYIKYIDQSNTVYMIGKGIYSIKIELYEKNGNTWTSQPVSSKEFICTNYNDLLDLIPDNQNNNSYEFLYTINNNLSSGNTYGIKYTFVGYSKYGINNINDTNEKVTITNGNNYIEFNTPNIRVKTVNSQSSIKAVKFDLWTSDAINDINSNPTNKYKAAIYIAGENTVYQDNYYGTRSSNSDIPQYELEIPNSAFVSTGDSNYPSKVEGLSFGIYVNRTTFSKFYSANSDINMEESVGLKSNTRYLIKITDLSNNSIPCAIYISTKPMYAYINAATNDVKWNQIKITTRILDKNNNYIYKDELNRVSTFRTLCNVDNNDNIILNEYKITAIAGEDEEECRKQSDLDQYIYNTNPDANNINAIFKSTSSNGEYEYLDNIVREENNETHINTTILNTTVEYMQTIHTFKNLTYYCKHKIIVPLTDGYNIENTIVYFNTKFPYVYFSQYIGGSYSKAIPYIFHNNEWIPTVAHIYKTIPVTKWRFCSGND